MYPTEFKPLVSTRIKELRQRGLKDEVDKLKQHFERALEISKRKNLMALLMYAEKYARLLFDRELHDSLLNELLAVDTENSKTLLIDTIARVKAKELLADAEDYF